MARFLLYQLPQHPSERDSRSDCRDCISCSVFEGEVHIMHHIQDRQAMVNDRAVDDSNTMVAEAKAPTGKQSLCQLQPLPVLIQVPRLHSANASRDWTRS